MAIAHRIKERVRDFYRTIDPAAALAMLEELQRHWTFSARSEGFEPQPSDP